MKTLMLTAAALALLAATPSLAAGDAAAGEKGFSKCKACHSIIDPTGAEVVKGGKVGPDLWGVVGRAMGTFEGFAYGDSIKAAGAAGNAWTEESIAEYVTDPSAFLQTLLNDPAAKGKMAFKLKEGGADIAAYLATFK